MFCWLIEVFCSSFVFLCQESKKHLAGLGTLGLGSYITEITANEDEDKEESRDSGNVDAEGERKRMKKPCRK